MAKNLDCTKAKQKISLVKVPPEVLRASQTVLESSTSATSSSATSDPTIGKIVEEVDLLNNDPSSSKQYFFEMADGSRHKLNITQQCAPLNVFSETKQGKLEVEGKIVRVVNMEPSIGDFKAYSQSVGERTRIAAAKTKRIKVIDIGNDAASKNIGAGYKFGPWFLLLSCLLLETKIHHHFLWRKGRKHQVLLQSSSLIKTMAGGIWFAKYVMFLHLVSERYCLCLVSSCLLKLLLLRFFLAKSIKMVLCKGTYLLLNFEFLSLAIFVPISNFCILKRYWRRRSHRIAGLLASVKPSHREAAGVDEAIGLRGCW
ncbi:uncharacterized protein LOC121976591 isoform X1 [Zingiber officinale]|uniref:uncharacterized protein LOC121976591 isoform X1 n=1 Tax=Zingiber officinale TaxID=94328 RepID=UPI001C4CC80C|nr:uncharacterized protein LOC121976591 isoform X1 [Zingiber officinale]